MEGDGDKAIPSKKRAGPKSENNTKMQDNKTTNGAYLQYLTNFMRRHQDYSLEKMLEKCSAAWHKLTPRARSKYIERFSKKNNEIISRKTVRLLKKPKVGRTFKKTRSNHTAIAEDGDMSHYLRSHTGLKTTGKPSPPVTYNIHKVLKDAFLKQMMEDDD